MIDAISKDKGNGYLLKGSSPPATYDEFKTALTNGTLPVDINYNASGWQVEGTPLNKSELDNFLAGKGITTGSSTAYILDDEDFNLIDGALIRFKLHVDSGATPTINVNNTGAKALMADAYIPMKGGTKAGTWVSAVYSSTLDFFVLQGSMMKQVLHNDAYAGLLGLADFLSIIRGN